MAKNNQWLPEVKVRGEYNFLGSFCSDGTFLFPDDS